MKCPKCGFDDSKVIDSRPADDKIRRRRECLSCKERFTTYELIEDLPLKVTKKDGSIEDFDERKLTDRLLRATVKRPVKLEQIEALIRDVVAEFKNNMQRNVTSFMIGDLVLRKLKDIDKVAYIRFASVYRDFTDLDGFVKIITELSDEANRDASTQNTQEEKSKKT
jgi:transcriptional repressor NrdR